MTLQTPIEFRKEYFFKRQDIYTPFPDIGLSGAKVAQCETLIRENLALIQNDYNNTVITATSNHSPQGLIVARVAYEYNLRCVLVLGGSSKETALKHKFTNIAVNRYNAELDTECKLGYNTTMNKRIEYLVTNRPMFNVGFGMNIQTDNSKYLVDVVAKDTVNIPENIDSLVIPVGSGLTATAILYGIERYAQHKPKKVVCVQIANYDRTKQIQLLTKYPFHFVKHEKYPYSKLVYRHYHGIDFDPRYESKAFEYVTGNRKKLGENVLYWIIGTTLNIK